MKKKKLQRRKGEVMGLIESILPKTLELGVFAFATFGSFTQLITNPISNKPLKKKIVKLH
jgi:hypothetical protein